MLVVADVSQDITNSTSDQFHQGTGKNVGKPALRTCNDIESSVKTPTQRYLICDDRKKETLAFTFKISKLSGFSLTP